ncbi:MAG: hypothetical protein DIU78_018370 [Pseudomonadota bacterium]|nr:MAG: hypothetical protein DIU78_05595 [Pseudomonadota bacterium]
MRNGETNLTNKELVQAVVELTGLTPMLGPGTVRRALRDSGVDPAKATEEDMLRALPRLFARLTAFQTEAVALANTERIESFLRSRLG